jgi:cobyrinic acid a,c-diamide synthase
MRKPGLTLGYREVEITQPCILGQRGLRVRGHEFHYSTLQPRGAVAYVCRITDAQGHARGDDGLMVGNTVALYTHLHFSGQPQIAQALIASARTWASRVVSRGGPT